MCASLADGAKLLFEKTFHPANLIAGVCDSYTIDDIKILLEHASVATKQAREVGAFSNYIQVLGEAGEKLEAAAKDLNRIVGGAAAKATDVSSACKIAGAVRSLLSWTKSPHLPADNLEAAKAFDLLFDGTSTFFAKLPANPYGKVFSEIGKNNFFAKMAQENPSRTGSQVDWQEVNDVTGDPQNATSW